MAEGRGTKAINSEDLYLSRSEYLKVQEEFCDSIYQLTPGLCDQCKDLLDRISTPNWALEWGLPQWLGDAFGLPEQTVHELTMANVFLLGFVRIIDDVVDDDFQRSSTAIEWISNTDQRSSSSTDVGHENAILLGSLLHNLWQTYHIRILSQSEAIGSPRRSHDGALVSRYLDVATRTLSEWINATSDTERRTTSVFSEYSDDDYLRIGHRFSLLKTCCTVACLVAGRDEEIRPLCAAIDHILISVVMMDDIFDWPSDLHTGRYNVFIAFCSDIEQNAEFRNANELATLRSIYLGQRTNDFFDIIFEHVSKAENAAMSASSSKLRKYISCLRSDLYTHRDALNSIIMAQLHKASDQFMNARSEK